jgi:hypothetical protein
MRARRTAVPALCALTCLFSASPAPAQERSGFWIGFGGGVGSAGVSCDDCEGGDRETAAVGYVKLGGTLSERVLLGAEVNLWSKEQEGVTLNLYDAVATLTFYPQPTSGFFLKGGVGASFLDTEFRDDDTRVTVDLGTGLGVLAGAGYDIRVGRRISITPAVNYWYGWPGDIKLGGETVFTSWRQNVVDFTVGVTFH